MTRESYLLLGFVAAFAAVNAWLMGTGRLATDWTGAGVIVAAGLTLSLYTFLYRDNPLFKLAEHVFVGVAAAYVFGQYWYPIFQGELITRFGRLAGAQGAHVRSSWWLLVPTVLGLLMLTRLSRRLGWLSRIAFAFVVGLGAGLTIPRYISAFVLAQVEPTLAPITWTWKGLNLLLILLGVVTVLVYFFFSVEHRGVVGHASRVGIWFLMVSFGASFGYTIMARLSLLIGRMTFLLHDWLHAI
ncbi:MAG: hypothetical protein AB1505_22405 [Candidatus Latescibacterota bacterium]